MSPSAVREGAPLVALLAGAGVLAARRSWPAGAAILGIAAWAAWFFRDPPRRCPAETGVLYSAADGRVLSVEEVDWDWHVHGRALRIATFLSPLDVHVNRSPAAGRIVASRRDPGPFAPAFLTGRSSENARQLLALDLDSPRGALPEAPADAPPGTPTSSGSAGRPPLKVVVAQVVGFMARRIVSWRLPGDHLAAGEKLGMIRFGSRTDVLVPAGTALPLVSAGDRVFAGITPIARLV